MILSLLAFVHSVTECFSNFFQNVKSVLRRWLGPAPRRVYLLPDQHVTEFHTENVPYFCPIQSHIREEDQILVGRGTRMPWVHLEYIQNDQIVSFSDWISQIRYHTLESPTLLQTFRLATYAHHMYLPEQNARLVVITRTGEEEIYAFRGATFLSLITSVHDND